jgi:hypothetical protein
VTDLFELLPDFENDGDSLFLVVEYSCFRVENVDDIAFEFRIVVSGLMC